MADNELTIILRLDDKASKEVAAALKSIGVESESAADKIDKNNDKAEKGTTKHKDALLKARDAVKSFHKEMFVLAIAVGAGAAAMNAFAERNDEARSTMDRLGLAFKNWGAVLGSVIAPALNKISEWIEKLNSGLVKGNLDDSFERAKIAVKNFNDDLAKSATLFQAGQISAVQYYDTILDKQQSAIAVNKEAQNSLSELAILTAQVNNQERMDAERKTSEQIELLNFYKQEFMTAHQGMAAFTVTVGQAIQTNLSGALTGIITGAKTAKQAFSDLGKSMINAIVDFMVQKTVAWVLEKTLLAGTVTSSVIAGQTVAAAWADAAAFVSLATFGSNAIPAAAGIATVTGLVHVKSIMSGGGQELARSGFAEGTPSVPGYATGTDTVPAMLSPGEMIFPKRMSDAIRNGDITVSGRSNGGGGDINIFMSGVTISSRDSVRDLAEELGFEIERRSRSARSNI